jgi:hypothetical protein
MRRLSAHAGQSCVASDRAPLQRPIPPAALPSWHHCRIKWRPRPSRTVTAARPGSLPNQVRTRRRTLRRRTPIQDAVYVPARARLESAMIPERRRSCAKDRSNDHCRIKLIVHRRLMALPSSGSRSNHCRIKRRSPRGNRVARNAAMGALDSAMIPWEATGRSAWRTKQAGRADRQLESAMILRTATMDVSARSRFRDSS